jgi:hypothetical protein
MRDPSVLKRDVSILLLNMEKVKHFKNMAELPNPANQIKIMDNYRIS